MTSSRGKSVQEQNYFSVRPASVRLSVISSLTTGSTFTKLATWLRLMVRVCESKIIFLSVCLFVHSLQCLSVRHIIWIWADFNQTCCMTFSHCKGVQEQHFPVRCQSVRCPYICPSRYFLLNHWAEFNQTYNKPFIHDKSVRERVHPSVYPSIRACVWMGEWGSGGGVAMARHRLRILVLINQDYKNNLNVQSMARHHKSPRSLLMLLIARLTDGRSSYWAPLSWGEVI